MKNSKYKVNQKIVCYINKYQAPVVVGKSYIVHSIRYLGDDTILYKIIAENGKLTFFNDTIFMTESEYRTYIIDQVLE